MIAACCKLAPTLARHMWRHNYVIDRNEYRIFTLWESINPWVYWLQLLFKSTNNSWRYERNSNWPETHIFFHHVNGRKQLSISKFITKEATQMWPGHMLEMISSFIQGMKYSNSSSKSSEDNSSTRSKTLLTISITITQETVSVHSCTVVTRWTITVLTCVRNAMQFWYSCCVYRCLLWRHLPSA